MGKKQTRARSYVDVYLKETGLINTIGNKRWDEFLDDVYTSFKKSKVKIVKSKSEGDLCVVKKNLCAVKKDSEIERKLIYNKMKKCDIEMRNLQEHVLGNRVNEDRVDDERLEKDRVDDECRDYDCIKDKDLIESKENLSNNNLTTPSPPLIPDYKESYYNNGYLQSVAHPFAYLKHPPFENPYLFKPKIKREEIDLRIQAVFGLLKLKNVKKNK